MNVLRCLSVVVPVAAFAILACGSNVGTVRMGPVAPARPLDCSLELIDVPMGGTPSGSELLGYVHVVHDVGKAPNDPEVLKLVKPEACKLGGEQVSPSLSGNFTNGMRSNSSLTYMVWRKKVAPSGPMKF